MTHDTLHWEQTLRRAGHRVTRQRGIILDAVCAGAGHTSLGEIYARAHRKDPSLDRSTIYRALKLFVEVGLAVAAEPGDGETYYEIKRPEQHHHLVCRNCGGDQEIDDAVFHDLVDRVAEGYGFHVATDHVVLFGVCASCREAASLPLRS